MRSILAEIQQYGLRRDSGQGERPGAFLFRQQLAVECIDLQGRRQSVRDLQGVFLQADKIRQRELVEAHKQRNDEFVADRLHDRRCVGIVDVEEYRSVSRRVVRHRADNELLRELARDLQQEVGAVAVVDRVPAGCLRAEIDVPLLRDILEVGFPAQHRVDPKIVDHFEVPVRGRLRRVFDDRRAGVFEMEGLRCSGQR